MSSDEIDALLERYLTLLDTYTTLRASLTQLQSSVHTSISRANFSSQRGIRYGQDYYDERIQALRTLSITHASSPSSSTQPSSSSEPERPHFKILSPSPSDPKNTTTDSTTSTDKPASDKSASASNPSSTTNTTTTEVKPEKAMQEKKESTTPKQRDPIHMFGILIPQPLREAQRFAIELVEDIVPRIVEVDVEMRGLEIQIRRARKRLGKEERRVAKEREVVLDGTGLSGGVEGLKV